MVHLWIICLYLTTKDAVFSIAIVSNQGLLPIKSGNTLFSDKPRCCQRVAQSRLCDLQVNTTAKYHHCGGVFSDCCGCCCCCGCGCRRCRRCRRCRPCRRCRRPRRPRRCRFCRLCRPCRPCRRCRRPRRPRRCRRPRRPRHRHCCCCGGGGGDGIVVLVLLVAVLVVVYLFNSFLVLILVCFLFNIYSFHFVSFCCLCGFLTKKSWFLFPSSCDGRPVM